jgi:hypothetical protein
MTLFDAACVICPPGEAGTRQRPALTASTSAVLAPRACRYVGKRDPSSSHSRIVAQLRTMPEGSRILDIGTATGVVGEMLQGRGFWIRGIEPNPEWAEAARRHYDELLSCRLEDAPEAAVAGHDAVVCADVLEHLPDPTGTLCKLAVLQQPSCQFFISVPNVANIWVRMNLLRGRFPYSERGILDRTHLRFFTLDGVQGMLTSAGLVALDVNATPIPIDLAYPSLKGTPQGKALCWGAVRLANLRPTLFGYQFVVRAALPLPTGSA